MERLSFDNPGHDIKQESIFIFIFPLLLSYIISSSTCLSSEEEDSLQI